MIPFAPSLSSARELLSDSSSGVWRGKELARVRIAGDRILSVPVEGGASILKRRAGYSRSIMISEHGAWRREHLGAWQALYGRAPFFTHLFPRIEHAYEAHSSASLEEFNDALWEIVMNFLDLGNNLPCLAELRLSNPGRVEDLHKEFSIKVNENYSIFDALFRLGKNTLFLL